MRRAAGCCEANIAAPLTAESVELFDIGCQVAIVEPCAQTGIRQDNFINGEGGAAQLDVGIDGFETVEGKGGLAPALWCIGIGFGPEEGREINRAGREITGDFRSRAAQVKAKRAVGGDVVKRNVEAGDGDIVEAAGCVARNIEALKCRTGFEFDACCGGQSAELPACCA